MIDILTAVAAFFGAFASLLAALGAWSNGREINKLREQLYEFRGRVGSVESTMQTMLALLATGRQVTPLPGESPPRTD